MTTLHATPPCCGHSDVTAPDPAWNAYRGAVDAWLDLSDAAARAFVGCEAHGLSDPATFEAIFNTWYTACEARRAAGDYRDHLLAEYAAARQAQKGGC